MSEETLINWDKKNLGEIGEYINGRAFKPTEWSKKGLRIIRIQDLTGTVKDLHYYDGDVAEKHIVNTGDFLIAWSATLGAFIWNEPKAVLNQHIFKVNSYIDKKFHYFLIQQLIAEMYRHTHGSGMVHITKKKFEALPVLIPQQDSLQKQIVKEIEKQFSRLDKTISDLKRVKANLKRYKASVLQAAVTGKLTEEWRKQNPDVEPASQLLERILTERRQKWETTELAKLTAKGKPPKNDKWKEKYKEPFEPTATGFEVPTSWATATVQQIACLVQYGSSSKTNSNANDGVPVLRMGNIVDGHLVFEGLKYLPHDHREFPELLLDEEDMLFNRTNSAELVGKSAVYLGSPVPCSFASYLIRVRFPNEVKSKFIAFFINSAFGRQWIKSVVNQQVGQANVNGTKLQNLTVPLPSSLEQNAIIQEIESRLSVAEELERTVDTNLKRAERLRQSILKQAFSGKLM